MQKSLLAILIIVLTVVLISMLNKQEILSVERITDDGFYYRYMGITCTSDGDFYINFKLGLTPVRQNQYDACSDTNIEVALLGKDNLEKKHHFVWKQDEHCNPSNEKIETINILLRDALDDTDAASACSSPDSFKAVLTDYEYLHRTKLNVMADPLGQQPRIDSSVPPPMNISTKIVDFGDPNLILQIQQKLHIQELYNGTIDGVWNDELTIAIRNLLDSSHLFFIPEKDKKILEILDIRHE